MIKLTDLLNQILSEEKKKADRCLRIARRKYDKSSAYRSGAIVRCRRGEIWKGIKEEEFKIQYKEPDFEFEWNEAIRYPEFKQMGEEGWINLAKKGYTTKYSQIEDILGNVDLNFNTLEADKKKRFQQAFETGTIELPIAVKFDENNYDLVAGNTRLAGLVDKGIDPLIWIVDLISEILTENQKPSEELFNQAIQDIKTIIPQLSHDIIHRKNLEHNEENMVKINKELLKKVYAGDDDILDKLWDLAGNSLLRNSINIITAYTTKLDYEEALEIEKELGIEDRAYNIDEVITTNNKPVEDSFLTKALNSLSKFIRGEELVNFLKKIKTLATFDNFILKYETGTEGANQFIINILDKNNNNKVGKFVAFIYKDKNTKKYSLQIQKVEIYPEYKGKGIMRNFYREFNEWLKSNFDNFDKFTSDFIFLYNKDTGKYDGFSMWEDLVKKGLAKRLGPDENYIPPSTPPKDGMWRIKTGYALKEELNEAKKETLRTWFKRKGAPGKTGGWVDCNSPIRKDGKITGYKPCGRQEGETRSKYPSCRPTPSKCKDPGKGKKWGKTK